MRSPGEGCITQRPNGTWQASLQVGGKRKVVYARTEREARRKLQELQKQLAQCGSIPQPGRRTVSDLLDLWLQTASLKPVTLYGYREVVDRHIKPRIGNVKLSRLEAAHLQKLYSELPGRRLPSRAHAILHRALSLATLWGWLPFNVADRVLTPTYKAPRKEVWSNEQLQAFLEGSREHWLYPLWVVALSTGCRLGELLALRWGDVDRGSITIRKTLVHIGTKVVESTPKSAAGERTIFLPSEGIAVLKRQRAQQNEWRLACGDWKGGDYVFTGRGGRPLRHSTVEHALARECARLGLPLLSPHGLRHLHASLLLSKGLPLTDVSARLGHANPNITASVYAHALPGRDAEAARMMGEVLRERR